VLQLVAVCCSVLQYVAVCCSVLQKGVSSAFLQSLTEAILMRIRNAVRCSVLQRVAVCCSVLQRVAVCCNKLQCVAVCCRRVLAARFRSR